MALEPLTQGEVEQIFDIAIELLGLNDPSIIFFTVPNIPGYKRTVTTPDQQDTVSFATVMVDGWRITSPIEYWPNSDWRSPHAYWQAPTTSIRFGGQRVFVQYQDGQNFGCRRRMTQFVMQFG